MQCAVQFFCLFQFLAIRGIYLVESFSVTAWFRQKVISLAFCPSCITRSVSRWFSSNDGRMNITLLAAWNELAIQIQFCIWKQSVRRVVGKNCFLILDFQGIFALFFRKFWLWHSKENYSNRTVFLLLLTQISNWSQRVQNLFDRRKLHNWWNHWVFQKNPELDR